MENIFFNNSIQVSVTQTPEKPSVGDDVTFKTSVILSKTTDQYEIKDTYFFSYTWMVSSDGGNNFYQIGSDLEELIIYDIDQNFFNNIYKVKVALIDLDNIILTEDGDNLTTQFGEILLLTNSNSSLSVQSLPNNSSTTNLSPSGSANKEESLDISNLEAIIADASAYDTTITPETSAEVFSGQIKVDEFINSQTPIVLVPKDTIPEIVIETDPEQQSIMGTNPAVFTREYGGDCGTVLSYDICRAEGVNPGTNPGLQCCSEDIMITIDNIKRDKIAYLSNWVDETRGHCCKAGPPNKICQYELLKGEASTCYIDGTHYKNDPICIQNSTRRERQGDSRFFIKECGSADTSEDCGCNGNGQETLMAGQLNIKTKTNDQGLLVIDEFVSPHENASQLAGTATAVIATTTARSVAAESLPILANAPIPTTTQITLYGRMASFLSSAGRVFLAFLGKEITVVVLGLTIVGGLIYYAWYNSSGGKDKKQLCAKQCYDVEYFAVYRCESDPPGEYIVDSGGDLSIIDGKEVIPTICDCVKDNGEEYEGSITIESNGCDWFVTSYTGKPGSNCICNKHFYLHGYHNNNMIPFQYSIPNYYNKLFTINTTNSSDCIETKNQCNAKCIGPYCCGPKIKWRLIQGKDDTFKCNGQETEISSPHIALGAPFASIKRIPACEQKNDNEINVQTYALIKQSAVCNWDKAEVGRFDTKEAALADIDTKIGQNMAMVFIYEEANDPNAFKELIHRQIVSSDGRAEVIPALFKHAKENYIEAKLITGPNGDYCDLCKSLYSISEQKAKYPCNDVGVSVCGTFNAKCNVTDSVDITDYTLVTIHQIKNPTVDQIKQIGKDLYDNIDDAETVAKQRAAPVGIVCSDSEE